ncbi:MAG: hypothetical protein ACD_71C00029G0001, partial [uncultured bacterium (gcode 4)]
MVSDGQSHKTEKIPWDGDFERGEGAKKTPDQSCSISVATGASAVILSNKDIVAHILNADRTIDFDKLISFLKGDDIVAFLQEQMTWGDKRVFHDFFDFLEQTFFKQNNPLSEDLVKIVRGNSVLKGHITSYLKPRNLQVLSEQNLEQNDIISFHLFLLWIDQDFDLIQDTRVNGFEGIMSLFSQYSWEIGKMSGKIEKNVWGADTEPLIQEFNLDLNLYIGLCETIIKLGVIHSVNLEERKIAFDLSTIIKSHTKNISDKLKERFPDSPKRDMLTCIIWRSKVNFARWKKIIDGKTRKEIMERKTEIKQEQKEGFDMIVSSGFWGNMAEEAYFRKIFEWEQTCADLIWLEKIERLEWGLTLEDKKEQRELFDKLLSIYNSWIDTGIASCRSAIDDFVTKDHLKNEFQIETIYHIVCFDKSLDEDILKKLLNFFVTKGEFPNALYEQFAGKIIEKIIKIFSHSGTKKISGIHDLVDQTFLYIQGKNSSNFILWHSQIYLALAYYYIQFPDEESTLRAQKAFLHSVNLNKSREWEIRWMNEKEKRFFSLLWEKYFKSLWNETMLPTEEKVSLGQDTYRKFSEKYESDSINAILTEVLWLISQISKGDSVYSAQQINDLIGQKIAEKLIDNLCAISIIGECKNCAYRRECGKELPCENDKMQCKSRKMKRWFQAEYIDLSNGLSLQFTYPVISARIFERIFVHKRDIFKAQFDNLIIVNTQKGKEAYLAFHDRDTGLLNRNKLEEDILGKERTLVFLEVADYDDIHSFHWGREDWIILSKKIAQYFGNISWFNMYLCEGRIFCFVFEKKWNGDNDNFGMLIKNIINDQIKKFNDKKERPIQFHVGIAVWKTEHHTRDAYIALIEAEDSWENEPYIFQQGDEKKPEQDRYLADILQKALNENNKEHSFVPHYQRIYYPWDPERQCVEALARIEVPSEEGR